MDVSYHQSNHEIEEEMQSLTSSPISHRTEQDPPRPQLHVNFSSPLQMEVVGGDHGDGGDDGSRNDGGEDEEEDEDDADWMFTQQDDRGSFAAFGSDAGLLTQMDAEGASIPDSEIDNHSDRDRDNDSENHKDMEEEEDEPGQEETDHQNIRIAGESNRPLPPSNATLQMMQHPDASNPNDTKKDAIVHHEQAESNDEEHAASPPSFSQMFGSTNVSNVAQEEGMDGDCHEEEDSEREEEPSKSDSDHDQEPEPEPEPESESEWTVRQRNGTGNHSPPPQTHNSTPEPAGGTERIEMDETEDTLVVEDSLSPGPLKSIPCPTAHHVDSDGDRDGSGSGSVNHCNSHDPEADVHVEMEEEDDDDDDDGDIQPFESQNAWKGFTEEDDEEDASQTNAQQIVESSPISMPMPGSTEIPKDVPKNMLPLDMMHCGFTEDSGVDSDDADGERGEEIDVAKDTVHEGGDTECDVPSGMHDHRKDGAERQVHRSQSHGGTNSPIRMDASLTKVDGVDQDGSVDSPLRRETIPEVQNNDEGDNINLGATSMMPLQERDPDPDQGPGPDAAEVVEDIEASPNRQIVGVGEEDMMQVEDDDDGDETMMDVGENKEGGNSLSIFTGDTQPIPSQFPFSAHLPEQQSQNENNVDELQANGDENPYIDHEIDGDATSKDEHATDGNENNETLSSAPTAKASLDIGNATESIPAGGTHSFDSSDSFYGGSTEDLRHSSRPSHRDKSRHGIPSQDEQSEEDPVKKAQTLSVANNDSEKLDGNEKVENLGGSLNNSSTQSVSKPADLKSSLPNALSPVHNEEGMGLSYPQDYLRGNNSQESKLSPKASGAESLLTITPHSQILLDPPATVAKKPAMSVAEKVADLKLKSGSRASGNGIDDDICDSSDEEEASLRDNDPRNRPDSIEGHTGHSTDRRGHLQPNTERDTKILSNETYITRSPLSIKRKGRDNQQDGDALVNDCTQTPKSSRSKSNPGSFSKKLASDSEGNPKYASKNRHSPPQKTQDNGVWLKTRKEKASPRKREKRRYDIQDSDDDEMQFEIRTEESASDSGVKSSTNQAQKREMLSDLEDTQPNDDEDEDDNDDQPLISLRRVSRGMSKRKSSHFESSDEENEFTDEWDTKDGLSQTTRAIKRQLEKFDNLFDPKMLEKKLKAAQGSDNASSKKELRILKDKNKALDKKNRQLIREKETLRKQLAAANSQLKEKSDLLVQMKKRLDDCQPILEAVQKIGFVSSTNVSPKTTKKKSDKQASAKKLTPKKRSKKKSVTKQFDPDNDDTTSQSSVKKSYRTPTGKYANEQVNVVSISNRKVKKQKARNREGITFSNLWNMLQERGWKHKNGPEPFNQVYVPPGGSVKFGSKFGVDFFDANDLWKKAEELGIIDSDSDDDTLNQLNKVVPGNSRSKPSRTPSPIWQSKSPQITKAENSVEAVTPTTECPPIDGSTRREHDNTTLHGQHGTMTMSSMSTCTSLIQHFAELGNSGHFIRDLFSPLWDCLSNKQGHFEKELSWRYCRATRRGSGNLGRDYWFCPPNSNGSKGIFGKDYFTTEEAVLAHVLHQLKSFDEFAQIFRENDDIINDIEIRLSRAIEQHMSYSEVKTTAVSGRRKSNKENIAQTSSKIPSPANQVADDQISTTSFDTSTSTVKQGHKRSTTNNPVNLTDGNNTENCKEKFQSSQRTVEGAEILLELNKAKGNLDEEEDPLYDNRITTRGVKELLKFRRRAASKRKSVQSHGSESSLKRLRVSPSATCHLTQAPEDSEIQSFARSPQVKRLKNSHKNLPLSGLFFFGSGVKDDAKRTVRELGGSFLDDLQRFLSQNKTKLKLFFLSHVGNRRTHKYILAGALGVPMLNVDWVYSLRDDYEDFKKNDSGKKMPDAFNNRRYIRHRLPLGLSNETGLFMLQKASHAKHWSHPSTDGGKLLFEGINMIVSLEKSEFEKKWVEIVKVSGATIVSPSDIDKKNTKVDMVLVDSLLMPPHVTAVHSRLGKILNKIASNQPNALILDLSWATQCIIQRKLLGTDEDKRYRVDLSQRTNFSSNKSPVVDISSIKVKQFDNLTRYEVGDSVNFGSSRHGSGNSTSHGRIISIKYNQKTRKTTVALKVLEIHNEIEVVDGGSGVNSVEIDKSELQGHTVILSGKDFGDVAWSQASNIFMQKKVK